MNNLYNQYELALYYFQQYICNILNVNTNVYTATALISIFIAGFLTSLNPCFLSILPLSISYLNIKKLKSKNVILFILGLCSGFALVVIFSHILSSRYNNLIGNIPILSSIIFIFIAFNYLQILDFASFSREAFSFNIDISSFKFLWLDFSVGFICSLTTLPCSTPIILTVLFWLSNSRNWFLLCIYITLYFFGCFLSLFLTIFIILYSLNFVSLLKTWNFLLPLSGFFMLFLGFLSILENIFD